jgi:sporulation protein YlmC with PRC-barrel domain
MFLSELIRSRLRSESGDHLGHVFDVRVARDPRSSADRADQKWRIEGLVVGERGLIERFGLRPGKRIVPLSDRDVIAWKDVLRIGDGEVIVRDGARVP